GRGWHTTPGNDPADDSHYFSTWDSANQVLIHRFHEAPSGSPYWRGYLIESGLLGRRDKTVQVINSDALGCPFTDFGTDGTFYMSYNSVDGSTHVEGNFSAMAFRKNPAFVWWGPGGVSEDEIRILTGGKLADNSTAI